MSTDNVWQRLDRLDPERVTPGLDRVHALMHGLGDPHLAYPTAIIAGTNGKGSTAAMLSTISRYAGLRVGCYSSPHLVGLEERFQVDGHSISAEGLTMHLDTVLSCADRLVDSGELTETPSYFEVLTAVAFRYFAEARVDLALLEVGLGGRLDATNVTTPRVAVITSIGLDHTDWLGDDIAQIAEEKFAVVPDSGVAVVAPQVPAVEQRLRDLAGARSITLLESEAFPVVLREEDVRGRCRFDLEGRLRSYRGLELSLAGRHQLDNARNATLASEALDRRRMRIGSDAVWAGLRACRLPGRCEWIDGPPAALLDGAHNPDAANRLAEHLDRLRAADAFEQLHMVFGALRDKDTAGMAEPLFRRADSLVTTRAPSPRASSAAELLSAADSPAHSEAVEDPEAALAAAMAMAGPNDLICVCGSLYLLGQLRPLVRRG